MEIFLLVECFFFEERCFFLVRFGSECWVDVFVSFVGFLYFFFVIYVEIYFFIC